ncbi:unnamed protein product [Soboliphyme baturini]|uniref:SSD domain-containing protein n=1 Tax=Soboliphyme baturini TaxID=241478 RepID=A0A183ICC0_9BILA|nr:unnamed protein product [Soboliphyme baturini]
MDGLQVNPNFRFTFPCMEVFGMKVNLENNLGGVEEYRNGTVKAHFNGREGEVIADLGNYIQRRLHNTSFMHVFMNTDLFNEDIRKNMSGSLPYFAISVVLVTLFILVSTGDRNPVRSKSLEGALGSLCSIMAVISAFGLLCYLDVPFNPLVSVTPFMALAIGMDDTFLTINAWQQTDPRLTPKERLQKTISESASAVTVTSLTDIALFSIGTMTDTLAIKGFSIYTAVTMAFDFLYQITFFAGVILLSGEREYRNQKNLFSKHSPPSLTMDMLFREYYAPVLNNRWARRLSVVAFIVYLLISFWGCCHLQVDMNVSMLLRDDSPLKPYFYYKYNFERTVVTVTVHVQRPPDLTSEEDVDNFMGLVTLLESHKFSRGADTSLLWLKDYLRFIEIDTVRSADPYERFEEFLNMFQYQTYAPDIRWYKNESGKIVIGRFQFQSYYNTSGHWSKMTDLLKQLRVQIKKYDKYDVSIFIPDNAMWDLVIGCPDNTIQTVGIGIFCMIFMSAFFIPNYDSIFWVSLTLASMDLGVIGFLSLWGVTLNPVSVINIIMSLDFPVEYATHICHCYYKLEESNADEKIKLTLGKVGWSILQGGLTALAAALPLGLVRSYMIRIFFRTIVLVVSIGMLHALLWLPIFLAVTARREAVRTGVQKQKPKAR